MFFTCSKKLLASLVALAVPLCADVVVANQQDFDQRQEQQLRSHDFDVEHYRIVLDLEESNRSFQGETTITYTSSIDGLDALTLDAEIFEVTRVTDGAGTALRFSQNDGKLNISLARTLAKEERATLTIAYRVTNRAANTTFALDFREKTDTNPQLISSLNWPNGARHWFPSFDHPSDWATHETIITVKSAYKVVANGSLINETISTETGRRTSHWSQSKPQPTYLYAFVAGPYSVLEDAHGDLPLHYWVYPGDEDLGRQAFGRTAAMIAFFEDFYGTQFPWAKYDQIIIPGIGGGAESTGATLLGERVINNERNGDNGASDWLLAHEIAHHWWGNLVGFRDWGHNWLSESFAEHGDHLYLSHVLGVDEGALNLHNEKLGYLDQAHERFTRPVVTNKWDKPQDMFDAHAYQKGGVILNMFRDLVGKETFGNILKSFLATHAYSNATTGDFLKTVKDVTRTDYSWFFDQWLFKPGHPVLDVSSSWNREQGQLSLTITQTQNTSTGVPLFILPIKIGITTKLGKKIESIWLRAQQQTFTFELTDRPLLVHFDEGDILLKEWTFHKTVDELIYQLNHDSVMGRLWAVGELQKQEPAAKAQRALVLAASNDSFWAVRKEAQQVLDKLKN